jgi:hypothetical protein
MMALSQTARMSALVSLQMHRQVALCGWVQVMIDQEDQMAQLLQAVDVLGELPGMCFAQDQRLTPVSAKGGRRRRETSLQLQQAMQTQH